MKVAQRKETARKLLKKLWTYYFPPVPEDMAAGLRVALAQHAMRIAKVFAPLIMLFELVNMCLMLFYREGGLCTPSRRVYFTMYVVLFTSTLFVLIVMLLLDRRGGDQANRRICGMASLYGGFLSVWGLGITVYDQRTSVNVSVYISLMLFVAVLLYLKPWQAAAIFIGCQILFFLFIRTFQPETASNLGNYTNTSIIAVMSVMMAVERYRSKVTEYTSGIIITRQTEEIKAINEILNVQVFTDELTQLYNRRFLEEALPKRWEEAQKAGVFAGALMLDIDNFKRFNDTSGHLAGDACIQKIAQIIRSCTDSKKDCRVRYGGEEFLVLFFGRTKEEAALSAECIRFEVERACIKRDDGAGVVTISGGLYGADLSHDSSVAEFIRKADRALYESKASGKNRITTLFK